MAQRLSVDTQQAGLASRLRPLYASLPNDEFERMVARIAEIELFGDTPRQVDRRDRNSGQPTSTFTTTRRTGSRAARRAS